MHYIYIHCICICVCVYMNIYFINICIYIYINMHVNKYIYIYACKYINIYIYIYICMLYIDIKIVLWTMNVCASQIRSGTWLAIAIPSETSHRKQEKWDHDESRCPSGKLTVGPWKSQFFVETNLPTPILAKSLIYWRIIPSSSIIYS